MQPRERILAIATVALLALVGGKWLIGLALSPIQSREAQVEQLEQQLADKQSDLQRGEYAERKLRQFRARSLPANLQLARSKYQHWLANLAGGASLASPSVDPRPPLPIEAIVPGGRSFTIYHRLPFTMKARGTIEQVTKFLHDFYLPGYLHQIRQLKFQPLDNGQLDISLEIEALVMPRAIAKDDLPKERAERLALASFDDYKRLIVERNVFAAPNKPPVLAKIDEQKGQPASELKVQLSATDPDEGDKLKYELVEGPEGAKVDPASGQFVWQPSEKHAGKTFTAKVRVTDSAGTPLADTKEFAIKVESASDLAKNSYLTAFVESGAQPFVWLHERTTNKHHQVSVGEEFQIGEFRGKLLRIGSREIEVEADGKRLIWTWGKSLHEAREASTGNAASNTATAASQPG